MDKALEVRPTTQPNDYTCGHACLSMITGESIDGLIERFGEGEGAGFADLASVLVEYGIFPEMVNPFGSHPFPFYGVYIVGAASLNKLGVKHWVVVEVNDDGFAVTDPNEGREDRKAYHRNSVAVSEPLLNYSEIIYMNTQTLKGMKGRLNTHE